jgi:hypothetical protein
MKTAATLVLLLTVITSNAQSVRPLNHVRAQLKSLTSIEGSAVGYAGIPGRFFLLYPYCVTYGDEKTFSDFLKDESPIVAAMGALCILDKYPQRREEIMMRMTFDGRSVEVMPGGCVSTTMTLKALFEKIATDPEFIVPMRFQKKKPNQPVLPPRQPGG